jgi:hypothetical protein
MPIGIIAGEPGVAWQNNTDKFKFQFVAELSNTCGQCLQYHMQIGAYWPTPLHRRCRCRSVAVAPGQTAAPFVDFREVIDSLPPAQRNRVIGAANLKLVESGAVKWGDVVTAGRIRTLAEVVGRQKLSVKDLTKAGLSPARARNVYASAHGEEVETARRSAQAIAKVLAGQGMTPEAIFKATGGVVAGRVGIGGGPSGASRVAVKPPVPPVPPVAPVAIRGPTPKPKPTLPPIRVPVPMAAPAAPLLLEVQGVAKETAAVSVSRAIDELPAAIKERLGKHGVSFVLTDSIRKTIPRVDRFKPGDLHGGTDWDAIGAIYDPKTKTAAVADSYISAATGKRHFRDAGNVAHAMLHEAGHAVDEAFGFASDSEAFRTALATDAARIAPADRARWAYYLANGASGPSEAFAEVFSDVVLRGHAYIPRLVSRAFPAVATHIRDRLFTPSPEIELPK